MVWNELKYNCEIKRHLGEVKPILGNFGQIQQVIVNMLINAKQAMPDGGIIRIATKQQDKQLELSIADTGCGISNENIEKLFTPFFTTKEVGVGTGLGLSISYGILQDHEADINVQSKLGKGTTFTMHFPTYSE